MKKLHGALLLALLPVLFWKCGSENENLKETSLMEYGVPITILAPDSLDVNRSSIGFQEDITVKGPDDFSIQIFVSDAVAMDLSKIVKSHRQNVQENPYFYGFVEEYEDGFIFENRIDSTHNTFGFRHLRVMGGKEYVFQEPLLGALTEEQVRGLYEAVSFTDGK